MVVGAAVPFTHWLIAPFVMSVALTMSIALVFRTLMAWFSLSANAWLVSLVDVSVAVCMR